MRKTQWLPFLMLVMGMTVSYAGGGKISGRVIDAETNDPLIGVNILVEDLSVGTASDANGNYTILNIPSGTYNVKATYIGYTTIKVTDIRVSLDQTTIQNFALTPEVLEGQEVTVVAERPMIQKDLTASQKTTTAEEIKAMPVENFLGVLTTQAGVNVGANGALHIRGGRDNEVAYYIDGVSVSNPFFTNSLAINVSNQALEEMKVISGAFNAEYGNAMSGVVNLQIKEGGKQYHGNLTAYSGDYISNDTDIYLNIDDVNPTARYVIEGTLNGPVPVINLGRRITFNLTGKYRDNQGYYYGVREHTPGDWAYFPISGEYEYQMGGDSSIVPMNTSQGSDILFKLTYKISPMIKISGQYLHGRSNYKSYIHSYKYNPDGVGDQESNNNNYSLKFNHALSAKTFYELNVFSGNTDYKHYYSDPIDLDKAYSSVDPDRTGFYIVATLDSLGREQYELYNHGYYESLRIFGQPSSATFNFGGTERTHSYRSSLSKGGKFDITSQINPRHELKSGLSYRIDELDERIFTILFDGVKYRIPTILPENSTSSHSHYNKTAKFVSGYVQDKLEYQNFIMNIGLRYDSFDPNAEYIADLLNPSGERKIAKPKQMWSPRIGVALPITDQGIFHFSYGHFYQMPTLRYLFREPIIGVSGSPLLGYADLNPEKTVTYEFGLQQQLTPTLAIETNIFYKDIRDLLASQTIKYKGPSGPQSYSIYLNKDYGTVKGFTFSLTKARDPVTKLSAFLDYTYQVTDGNAVESGSFFLNAISGIEEEKNIVPLSWDQSHIINATTTFSEPNNWSVSIITKLSSGWPYTPDYPKYTELQNINPDPNSGRKPWQQSVDLLMNKSLKIIGIHYSIFAKIYNLFDRRNERYVFNDTGRAGYTFVNQSQQETDAFKNHYGEPGIHTWKEYQTRPNFYRSPRLVTLGIAMNF